jgi:N-acyl-D-amino-acid deacylase
LGVNVASLVPYSPLRIYVLGPDAALEREQVTSRELEQLSALLRQAMEEGAFGFSIDKLWENRMADGRLLPDHVASNEEVMALADVVAGFGVGHLSWTRGPSEKSGGDAFLRDLTARSGRPLNLVGIAATSLAPTAHRKMLAYLEESHRVGLPIYCSAICMDIPVAMTLGEFNMFDTMPNWVEPLIGTPAERAAKLANAEVRAAMRNDVERVRHQAFARGWSLISVLETRKESNHQFDGLTVAQIAARLGKDPLDAMLDLAIDEQLETVFGFMHVGADEEGTIELCRHPYTHISNSDGGAHVRFLTISTWPIHFLSRLVRDRAAMSLEQAHYKISGLPAYIAGFTDRGMLKVGMGADIIVYRLDELGFLHEKPVFAHDFPGGAPRLIQQPKGLHYTIVNGAVTFEDNRCTGALPGKLLRSYDMSA